MFFPSLIRYYKVDQNVFFKVKEDIYVRPMQRAKALVRVIASRLTPSKISGSEFAGLDVVVGTGRATTCLYQLEKFGRFKDAYIRYKEESNFHMRIGELPNQVNVNDFKGLTHFHFITCFKNEIEVPKIGDLYEIDVIIVNVYEMQENGTLYQLTYANSRMNELDCCFAINGFALHKMKSFKNLVVMR